MAFELDLYLGEAFAQIKGNGPTHTWYQPRRSLIDGLKEALGASISEGGHLKIKSVHLEKSSPTSAVATLTTAGFETLCADFSSSSTFAVSARLAGDGSELAGVDVPEIEALVDKLNLLNIRAVAICFLHSKMANRHEELVANVLRDRGLFAFCSHDEVGDETQRFSAAMKKAAHFAQLQDMTSELGTSLAALGDWTVSQAPTAERNTTSGHVLHLGFERFSFARGGENRQPLRIQPMQRIVVGPMNAPTFETRLASFGSGPMFLGRSFHPTVLDLLFATDQLDDIEVLKISQGPRLKNRILEMILTLAKDIESEYRIDTRSVANDLLALMAELIAVECIALAGTGPLTITGGLAPVIAPLLSKRRKGFEFKISTEAAL